MAYKTQELQRTAHKRWRDTKRSDPKYKAKMVENAMRHHRHLRLMVLTHYSEGKLVCACCSESNYEFLSLDHVNNDGAEKRRLHGGNKEEWRFLVKNNYPPGYQVLCYNCNIGRKNHGGVCPHKLESVNG